MFNPHLFQELVKTSPVGYAYHKIVYDEVGVPCDYVCIEMNAAFAKLTGVQRADIVGKPIIDVLAPIAGTVVDWAACFRQCALTGEGKEFDQYSALLDTWYRVHIVRLNRDYLATTVVDVTAEQQQIQDLRTTSQISEAFLEQIGSDVDYQGVTDALLHLAGAKFAAFNLYAEDGQRYRTMALAGDRDLINKAMGTMGMNVAGKEWPHDPIRAEKIEEQIITRFATLHDLAGDVIPKPLCDLLATGFGLGELVVVKISKHGVMIGDFTLIMPKQAVFAKDTIVEIYARQIGLMLERSRVEEQLTHSRDAYQENLQLLQTITDNMLDFVALADPEGNFTFVGKSHQVLGYELDSLVGSNVMELVHPDDRPGVIQKFAAWINSRVLHERAEYRICRQDGTFLWWETIGTLLTEDQQITGIVFNSRDITERKTADAALQEARDEYEKITNLTGDIIIQADTAGRWTFLNDTACQFFGGSREELLGQSFAEYLHPDDQAQTAAAVEEMDDSGEVIRGLTNRQRTVNGWNVVQWNAHPVFVAGEYAGFQATGRDITQQKQAEGALKQRELDFRNLAENAPDAIARFDPALRCLYANSKAETVFGFTVDQRLGADVGTSVMAADVLKRWKTSLKRAFQTGQMQIVDVVCEGPQGTNYYESLLAPEFSDDGQISAVLSLSRDLTLQKEMEFSLRDKEAELQEVHQIARLGRWDYHHMTSRLQWTEMVFEIFETDPAKCAATYENFLAAIHPDDRAAVDQAWRKSLLDQQPYAIEHRLLLADGRIKWVFEQCRTEFSSSGEPIRSVGIVQDVTDRKNVEREAQAKQQELDTYFTSSLDLLCIASTQGEFIRVNPEWEEVLGYSVNELEGKQFLDYVHPQDVEGTRKTIAMLENQQEVLAFSNRYRCSNGTYRWIEWRAKPVGDQIYAVARDITVRKAEEKRLQTLNENQATLLDISTLLMSATPDNVDTVVHETMARAANIAVADRVYVFEYDFEKQLCSNTYEWCGTDVRPQIDQLQNLPVEVLQDWLEKHQRRETVLIDDVNAMPDGDSIKRLLGTQDIQSMICVPLFMGDTLYGFVGFDAVKQAHQYAQEEEILLNQYGNNLLSTLVRVDYDRALRKSEEQNRYEKEQFKTTLLSVGDAVISTDASGNVAILNSVAEHLTGWTQQEAFGRPSEEVFYIVNEFTRKRCENPIERVLNTGDTIELANHTRLISKDGIERPIEDSAAPIIDAGGNIAGVVLVFRDFSEKKENMDEITYLSFHDHLTGLYNRRFFEAELARLDTERNLPITIMIGDINGLKLLNDSFGHAVGDELLIKAAQTVKDGFRADDIIARVGGDEYAVLLPKTDAREAEQLIKRIKSHLKKQTVRGVEVSAAFGFATKVDETQHIETILKAAEDNMYNQKLFEGPSIRGQAIENILAAIHNKSASEKAHSTRVSELCEAMGEALGLDEHRVNELRAFGLLHDIGKIAISDEILDKPAFLTGAEMKEMRRHSEIGYRILSTVSGMSEIADYVLAHHERWDGSGYPKGLKRNQIPLASRICAIADAYDAMTSDRSYRQAGTPDYARKELRANAGGQFDPELVKVLLDHVVSGEGTSVGCR